MTVADIWIAVPLFILACGAIFVLMLGAIAPGRYGAVVGFVAAIGAALWAMQTPPLAVSPMLGLSASPFARFFVVLFSLTAALALLLSYDFNDRQGITGEEYPATMLFAAFGMATLSCAANLLLLFLGLEALTFAFYILVAIDLNRTRSAEAGLKYLLMGAVSAAFIAFGVALIYCGAGSLQIAQVMHVMEAAGGGPVMLSGLGFLLMGIAFKISLVPAHLWTPDVYQGAPAPVVAFLSTGSKGAAFAALLLLFPATGSMGPMRPPLWWLCLFSMAVGNLAALLQSDIKRMLAYSSIAQMGYVTLAFLTGTRSGHEAVVFYLAAYTAMNLAAFGAIASFSKEGGMETVDAYRGLGYKKPFQGGVLALSMFSLAGIPPTAGFMGKFLIFSSAIRAGETPLAVIGILTAAASAYFYLRVVVNLYMHPAEAAAPPAASFSTPESIALGVASIALLALGIYPPSLMLLINAIL